MSTVRVYTVLKNTDLHALSAQEAIQRYLGFSALKGLRRVTLWELEGATQAEVEKILHQSFYLVNPNKEKISMTFSPKGHCLRVIEKKAENSAHLIEKIAKKTGVRLTGLRRFLVWEIFADASRQEIEKHVVVSVSRSRGLLINPVSQSFEWLSAS